MSAHHDNVVPLRRRAVRAGYAPGVTPFDPSNPAHISAWNTLHQLGWAEQRSAHVRPELETVK